MNSKIIICNGIHLHKDYKDVLSYSESDMVTLCQNHALATANNYSFIRERGTIQVGIAYSTCVQANYIAYQNSDYSNKWFFAFVDEVRYKNNNTTEIVFTIDVWSTWYSYITFNSCFVEREHVTDDTIGLHTLPENVETGDYVTKGEPLRSYFSDQTLLVLAQSDKNGYKLNGQYTGVQYTFFQDIGGVAGKEAILNMYKERWVLNDENIVCIFNVPRDMMLDYITWIDDRMPEGWDYGVLNNHNISTAFSLGSFGGSMQESLENNYVPVNNKLLCYPYRYAVLTNNNGCSNIYRFEYFKTRVPSFTVYASLNPSCSIIAVPLNYKHIFENFSENITGAKFPIATWTNDVYTNWLTTQGINPVFANAIASETELMQIYNAVDTYKLTMGIGSNMQKIYSHAQLPNTLNGNLANADVNFSLGNNDFKLYTFVIREEYAKIIDDYFTARGYQVNTFKVPNINTRPIFNYVKINNETDSITGNFANNFTEKLNGILKSGVTIWHNHDNIDNYSLDNRPVNN